MVLAERYAGRGLASENHPSPPPIFRIGNGIDLAYPYPRRPRQYRYEDKVFREVSTRPELGAFYTGPFAIDSFFSSRLTTDVRPDIMEFTKTQNQLILKRLIEIRRNDLDLKRKLAGFEKFWAHLRNDTLLFDFFRMLNIESIPKVSETTQEISIRFITPRNLEDAVYEDPRFARVDFLKMDGKNEVNSFREPFNQKPLILSVAPVVIPRGDIDHIRRRSMRKITRDGR